MDKEQKEVLEKKIKEMQSELNHLVSENKVLYSGRILELSQQLDVLISEYYKKPSE